MKLFGFLNPSSEETTPAKRWNCLEITNYRINQVWLDEPVGKPFWMDGTPISVAQAGEEEGAYIPWEPPLVPASAKGGDDGLAEFLPEDLYDLLDWSVLRPVYKFDNNLLDKLSSGLMIVMVVILLFFVYLIYSSQTGG